MNRSFSKPSLVQHLDLGGLSLAQVFRIEASDLGGFLDAVISPEFLMEYPPDKMGKALPGWHILKFRECPIVSEPPGILPNLEGLTKR